MREHPRNFSIWGHQPLTATQLRGYISILEELGLLATVHSVTISHADFRGLLLDELSCLTHIRRLELLLNRIDGTLDLSRVPAQRVVLIDNEINVPDGSGAYLQLSSGTRRLKLIGGNEIPRAERDRLRGLPNLEVKMRKSNSH